MNNAQELHNEIKKARLESKKALSKLIENYSTLAEGRRTKNMGRAIVKEAIVFERLTLLEAAGSDVHHIAEMMEGMKMSAGLLAKRLGLGGLEIWLDGFRIPDVFELDSMFLSKPHLKKFMKDFADIASLTKGLMALSNDLGETQGGQGGPLGEILKSIQGGTAKMGSDHPLGHLIDTYDLDVTSMKKPGKPSLGSRIKSKLGFGKGTAGTDQVSHNTKGKFEAAISNILRTKAPASVKIINPQEMTAALMKQPIKQIIRAFRAYPASVTHYVDDDMLMALSKGPGGVMGVLKGLADMFQSSGAAPSRG